MQIDENVTIRCGDRSSLASSTEKTFFEKEQNGRTLELSREAGATLVLLCINYLTTGNGRRAPSVLADGRASLLPKHEYPAGCDGRAVGRCGGGARDKAASSVAIGSGDCSLQFVLCWAAPSSKHHAGAFRAAGRFQLSRVLFVGSSCLLQHHSKAASVGAAR